MKFKDLVTNGGFLTPEGKKALSYLEITLIGFFARVDEEKLTDQQVITAGAAIMREMAEFISKERENCKKGSLALESMSDTDFLSYLDKKYGPTRRVMSLEERDLQRYAKLSEPSAFKDMSDEAFIVYLQSKYGPNWIFVSLTDNELDRLPKLTSEEMKETIEQGRRDKEAAMNAMPMVKLDPSLRFK